MSDNEILYKKAMTDLSSMIGESDPKENIFDNKSLEYDIETDWLLKKLKDDSYAESVYNALCNNEWEHVETQEVFHCSWRYAGGIVSHNRKRFKDKGFECYLDYYCSGKEGEVTAEIARDFAKLGWVCVKEETEPKDEITEDLEECANLIKQLNKE